MEQRMPKSEFKAHALECLRQVEQGMILVITDRGRPVARVIPYRDEQVEDALAILRGSVLRYDSPTEPLDEAWDGLS